MTPIRPLWVFVIWTFLFLFCLYVIFLYFSEPQQQQRLKEGMGEKTAELNAGSTNNVTDKIRYYPDPKINNYYREFRAGDLGDELVQLYTFIKIDDGFVDASGQTSDPASPGYGEYKQSVNDLAIYKSYNSTASNYDKYMERLMGQHFDAAAIEEIVKEAKTPKEKRKRILNSFSKDLEKEDGIYRRVIAHCFSSANTVDTSSNSLSSYFGDLIVKYADGKSQLETVKKAFFELMRPVVLMHYLCDNYEKEEERYKTADGKAGQYDSANYFLNTLSDLIRKLNLEKSSNYRINRKNSIYVFDDDKADAESEEIPLNAFRVYVYAEYASRIYSLLEKSTTIKMDKETFVAGFPEYLHRRKTGSEPETESNQNASKSEDNSLLVFLLKNPPKQ